MTQNIEQRTLAAVNQYENASGTIDKFAHADEVVTTPVGAVKTFPKISKEWDENSKQLTADWKAERDALSIKALPVLAWANGETETNINQQRRFTDGHTYLPKTVPAVMNTEPDANWIAYTADKSDVLSDVFGSKPVDLVNGLIITPVNNQYPKLAAFNAIYELADNSVSYTVKSFAQSVGGDCVITLSDDTLLIAKKVDAASQNWTLTNFDHVFDTVEDMKNATHIDKTSVKTRGYYASGDGGGAIYLFSVSATSRGVGDITVNNGVLLLQQDAHNAVSIRQIGVKADSTTINKLKPVGDFINSTGFDLIGSNDQQSLILFDDTINIKNSVFKSQTGLHIKYVGVNIDYKPVVSIGHADFSGFSPSRFDTSNWDNFHVGEILEFSRGGFGQVLFKQDGFVYFYFFSNGGATFPVTNDTVTGKTSGQVSGIRSTRPAIFPTLNSNAGIDKIYLTSNLNLDVDGIPLSHIKATGFQFNGVSNGGIAHAYVGAISAQGFNTGVVGHGCYSLIIHGSWQFDRCANGILQGDECWTATTFPQIGLGSIGTKYDNIKRYAWLCGYTYDVTVQHYNTAVRHGVCTVEAPATENFKIIGGDVEFCYVSSNIVLNAELYTYATDKTTSQAKNLRIQAPKISYRAVESFGVAIKNGVDAPQVSNISHAFTKQYISNPSWRHIVDLVDIADCTNVNIHSITSNLVDFSEANPTLKSGVTYSNNCYIDRYFSFNSYSPISRNYMVPLDQFSVNNKWIEIVDVNASCDTTSPSDARLVLSDKSASVINDLTLTFDSDGAYFNKGITNKYMSTNALKFRLMNLRTDIESYYSVSCRYRYLKFK